MSKTNTQLEKRSFHPRPRSIQPNETINQLRLQVHYQIMSLMHHDAEKIPAGDASHQTPTLNSSQKLVNNTATGGTSETPTSTSQELDKYTAANDGTSDSQTVRYPAPLALFCLMIAICVSIFLVSLDRTIITTVSERWSPTLTSIADQSHVRRYPTSRISSTPTAMSVGTPVHTLLHPVPFYQHTDAYMAC